jgi:hypothetical protein
MPIIVCNVPVFYEIFENSLIANLIFLAIQTFIFLYITLIRGIRDQHRVRNSYKIKHGKKGFFFRACKTNLATISTKEKTYQFCTLPPSPLHTGLLSAELQHRWYTINAIGKRAVGNHDDEPIMARVDRGQKLTLPPTKKTAATPGE